MGTVFSCTVRAEPTPSLRRALDAAEGLLHHVDEVFSPFRPDSAVSRVRHGRTVPEEWQIELREIVTLCADAHRRTGGRFAAWRSGAFDPSGLVKGWAVERAALLLREAGAEHVCLNGGGDVQLYGGPWRVGIAHPLRPGSCAAVLESPGGPLGIATSGPGERGCHIVDPNTGAPPTDGLASLTVTGPSLTEADVLATAAYCMGAEAREWLGALPGVAAFAVMPDGQTWTTGKG
ncbi:thiamine biosynthesis protein [Streptomyces sp. CS113]|uniref:FAD:protein FMN transferase n=2 Tax=Streptomyces TaxID=1883 RepID=A0A6N9USW2_9ACTN|nr:FAD:protein FMN transferase [Streptomyces coelicoflavus]NEB19539.1 FAD:protein FMN transferase [Streptomyces coelicoflavus]OWA12842.1 thiamine biosynthesis protein [Streptomyces sp. CS113]